MSAFVNDPERDVVPRWLSFEAAQRSRELDSAGRIRPKPIAVDTDALLQEWREAESVSVGCEVIGSAYTAGSTQPVSDIAGILLSNGAPTPTIERLCRNVLEGKLHSDSRFSEAYAFPETAMIASHIHAYKKRLRDFPWNAVLWTNLALLYTTLGQEKAANKAIRIALSLAPDSRFVLRASARFYLHFGEPDRARAILHSSNRLKEDPWLLANEIALSQVMERNSGLVKLGRRFVENERSSPFHLSELNSSISKLEFSSGNSKKAKRHCAASLVQPSENAIAQAAWMQRRNSTAFTKIEFKTLDTSQEAISWHFQKEGQWSRAFDASLKWQAQEPFSSRPAIQAGYLAITALDDYETAAHILSFAQQSNRDDPVLLNNLAFAHACSGRISEAEQSVTRATELCDSRRQRVVLLATKGLIEHRKGNHDAGKLLYSTAISMAETYGDVETAKTARVFALLEQLRDPNQLDIGSIASQANVTCKAIVDTATQKLLTERISRSTTSAREMNLGVTTRRATEARILER